MNLSITSRTAIVQGRRDSLIGFLKSITDPSLIVLTLFASILAHGDSIRGVDLLLAMLAFSLTYPGDIPFRHRKLGLFREIIGNWTLVIGILLLFGYAAQFLAYFDMQVITAWIVGAPLVMMLAHWVAPPILLRALALRRPKRAVIIGAHELGHRLERAIHGDPFMGTQVLAFFDDRRSERLSAFEQAPLAGRLEDVAAFVKSERVEQLYITLPMSSQPRILQLLDELRDTTASIYFCPDIFVFDLIQARMDAIDGMPVVAVCETPFHGTTGMQKRLSDLLIAAAALLVTAPLMLVIALAVKLDSPGPVLFKQRRYGLDGREIVVWKFRTMRVMEDRDSVTQATRNDSRVTRLGRLLRRSSLDELPQFFNVLQGRMSVVGPRPHAVAHNEQYRRLIKGYMVRHKVKPGITGWAQINGARGETDHVELMERRIRYDLDYLRNWSLRLDLKIVLATIALIFRDRNAY
ncbi:MAG: undecaprenyl-phosphate glucose phosphotransferase [Burkholderiaceae bacterium]